MIDSLRGLQVVAKGLWFGRRLGQFLNVFWNLLILNFLAVFTEKVADHVHRQDVNDDNLREGDVVDHGAIGEALASLRIEVHHVEADNVDEYVQHVEAARVVCAYFQLEAGQGD